MNERTERQNVLLEYLIQQFKLDPTMWVTKEKICNDLPSLYPRCDELSNEHNSSVYHSIRLDKRAINFSDVENIIISNATGYKIATKEEAEEYLKKQLKKNLVSLKLYWLMVKKKNLNGQLDIDLNEVETFIGDDPNGC